MFNLDLEKAEEPEIKLPTSVGSENKKGNFKKTSIPASLITLKPLAVWIAKKCGKFFKRWKIPDHLTCLLRNVYEGQEATVRIGHGIINWFQTGKGES